MFSVVFVVVVGFLGFFVGEYEYIIDTPGVGLSYPRIPAELNGRQARRV